MIVKLIPAVKNYLWGGTKLNNEYGKTSDLPISESWELSFCKDGLSTIDGGAYDGQKLCDVTTRGDWGENCCEFEFFPVLNKLIDAAKPLSVQVHPDDEYALKNEGQYGKTEMWHILSADVGAYIYLGFNTDMTDEGFAQAIADGSVCRYLNKVEVKQGQTYFIPSGTVHAIGAGVTLFEVQQNSSLTYRVYDYDRTDGGGNKRELHIEKAKAVCNLNKYTVPNATRDELLGKCKYFSAYRLSGQREVGLKDSFVSLTVTDGRINVGGITAEKGNTVFLSAGERQSVTGDGSYILTCVEKQ
ncbi:MAG: class I mannose-6-phosphate isomerase [Clostridiales bacterium]|nr:class I mannose-6-phosphate isomerase [Clostridiales bacterium]